MFGNEKETEVPLYRKIGRAARVSDEKLELVIQKDSRKTGTSDKFVFGGGGEADKKKEKPLTY